MSTAPIPNLSGFSDTEKPYKTRYTCTTCGGTVASFNANTGRTSVWAAQLERDAEGKIIRYEEFRPKAHIFYGTRMLDVPDGLPKWEGYAEKSARLE